NISDSANSVIVNQAFVERAGWKEPLAQEVKMMDGSTRNVIGIVSDYNYESLKRTIEPQLFSLAFNSENKNYQHLLIRIRPNSESNCISFIGKTFKELFPLYPFSYEFYNEGILLSYETESKWKQVILLSALLTIFIAGIGLFGLSIFTAETRVKEIAIRKVLGASVKTIVFLVYKEHFLLISLALIIALPISYYAAGFWLERYPYRTEFGPVVLITAALFVVAIAGVTVSYQTFKTALLNPASSLRTS
ncbi:MAG TPA: FtsX-like permease family protein, partial [Chryseolinea sp.]